MNNFSRQCLFLLFWCAIVGSVYADNRVVASRGIVDEESLPTGKGSSELQFNAQMVRVPETVDLKSLGDTSEQSGLPIVLVFSADNCSHCERLEEDVLRPMLFSGELNNKVLLRKYKIDGVVSIRDFQGNRRDAEDYSILRDVEFTPTIQFVDSKGREIIPAIVGYQTPELFQAYFREAISVSEKLLHEKSR